MDQSAAAIAVVASLRCSGMLMSPLIYDTAAEK
jgi:hypothetical protein